MTAKPHVLNLQVEIMFFIIRYLKVTSGLGFPVKIKQVFFFFPLSCTSSLVPRLCPPKVLSIKLWP